MDTIDWIHQRIIENEAIGTALDTVKHLNQSYTLVSVSTGSIGQSKLHGLLGNLRSFLEELDSTRDRLQMTVGALSLRTREFVRARQRFSTSLEGCVGDFVHLMTANTKPTPIALQALLQETDNGLSTDYDALAKAEGDLQAAAIAVCSEKVLVTLNLTDITDLEEGIELPCVEPGVPSKPAEASTLVTTEAVKQAHAHKEDLISTLNVSQLFILCIE